ncbi:MAG: zinc-dependent metalloprotease [Saprospiraceae bacterium]
MKTKILTIFLSISFPFFGFTQSYEDCGTTIVEQSTTYDFVQKQRSQTIVKTRTTADDVPVKIHIIGADNGAFAIDSSDVFDELAIVNDLYAEANIHFVPCGIINYIYDNDYVTFTKNADEGLCDINDNPTAINIYFVPNLIKIVNGVEDNLCGYAYNFDIKNRILMDKGCSTNGSTLAHELGHSFSLLHTHSTSNGNEHANGTNCSIAGDLLCDTPADPTLSNDLVNSSCEYIGTELDNQQNPYNPDTGNIMSYSRKSCRTHFSPKQLLQIEDFYLLEGGFLECDPEATPTNDLSEINLIEIYPNPSDASIFIKNIPAGVSLELIDLQGKIIWENQIKNATTTFEISSFQKLTRGIYFVKIKNGNSISTHKIVRM